MSTGAIGTGETAGDCAAGFRLWAARVFLTSTSRGPSGPPANATPARTTVRMTIRRIACLQEFRTPRRGSDLLGDRCRHGHGGDLPAAGTPEERQTDRAQCRCEEK